MRLVSLLALLGHVALYFCLSTPALAGAASNPTIFVNTTEDVVDPDDTLDGSMTAKVSLREAIQTANAQSGDSTIGFTASVFNQPADSSDNSSGTRTIPLSLGELDQITGNLVIDGPDDNRVIIDAGESSRIFTIASGVNVTINDLQLTRGNSASAVATGSGGAIYNNGGTLTLINALISASFATGNESNEGGGAIYNNGGTVTLGAMNNSDARVTLSGNEARGESGSGGAIFNNAGTVIIHGGILSTNRAARAGGAIETLGSSTTTLTNVAMSNNAVTSVSNRISANPGNGGGIHVSGAGTVNFIRSSATGNSAANEGGALWASNTGTMVVDSSTVSTNAGKQGGGIFFDQGGDTVPDCSGGSLRILHATVANNTASDASGGGGLLVEMSCDPDIDNSIFGNNQANAANNDIQAVQATIDNSLVEALVVATNNGDSNTVTTDTDPNLSSLRQDSATGTFFHGLNAATVDDPDTTGTDESSTSSPALDALANGTCGDLTGNGNDQRNAARNFDFNGTSGDDCDLGAYEVNTDVFAELEDFIDAQNSANSKNSKLQTVTAGQTDVQALAFNLQSKPLDETQTMPSSTIRVRGFSGTYVTGGSIANNTAFVPNTSRFKVWLDNNNDGTLDAGDNDITSSASVTIDTTAKTFEVDFNSNQDIAPNGQRGFIVTVDVPSSVRSAGLFGLPLLALALLQRRRSWRLGLVVVAIVSMLTACGGDDKADDLTDPAANTTDVLTLRITLRSIDAIESTRNVPITISPSSVVPGLLLHLTVPR